MESYSPASLPVPVYSMILWPRVNFPGTGEFARPGKLKFPGSSDLFSIADAWLGAHTAFCMLSAHGDMKPSFEMPLPLGAR